ncbi:hypothetical protein Tco_0643054, partial [Tanacetum coccineum]
MSSSLTRSVLSMSISWKKTGLLAMQETNNCGYLLYRSSVGKIKSIGQST